MVLAPVTVPLLAPKCPLSSQVLEVVSPRVVIPQNHS